MAANEIRLNATDAQGAVGKIKTQATSAQNTVNSLERDVKGVANWWKGESALAFVDEFTKSKKEFDKMIDCINKYAELLNKAIQIQQETDAKIAQQMRQSQ